MVPKSHMQSCNLQGKDLILIEHSYMLIFYAPVTMSPMLATPYRERHIMW